MRPLWECGVLISSEAGANVNLRVWNPGASQTRLRRRCVILWEWTSIKPWRRRWGWLFVSRETCVWCSAQSSRFNHLLIPPVSWGFLYCDTLPAWIQRQYMCWLLPLFNNKCITQAPLHISLNGEQRKSVFYFNPADTCRKLIYEKERRKLEENRQLDLQTPHLRNSTTQSSQSTTAYINDAIDSIHNQ